MLVVFDGLDGSGKTTQALLLCRHLSQLKRPYVLRTHPSGDCFFGRMAGLCLLTEGRRARFSAGLFYLLDVLRSVVLYTWRRVDYVVFVRYLMGAAYLPEPLHKLGYLFLFRVAPRARYMFFLDTPPEEAYRRIRESRRRREVFESLGRLRCVYRRMRGLASRGEWVVLDGSLGAEEVHLVVRSVLGL